MNSGGHEEDKLAQKNSQSVPDLSQIHVADAGAGESGAGSGEQDSFVMLASDEGLEVWENQRYYAFGWHAPGERLLSASRIKWCRVMVAEGVKQVL